MFKIVSIIQGNHRICTYKEAVQQLEYNTQAEMNFIAYEIFDIDNNEAVLEACLRDLEHADFVYMDIHGGLTYFKSYLKLCDSFVGKKKFYFYSGVESEIEELFKQSMLTPLEQKQILNYETAGGLENIKNQLYYIGNKFGKIDCAYGEVIIPKWEGIYKLEKTEAEFRDEILHTQKPIIGVLIHFHYIQNNNTKHIDALLNQIQKQGAMAYPVFSNIVPIDSNGSGGLKHTLETYFIVDGRTIIDSLIITTGMALSITSAPGSGGKRVESSVFECLDIPVFQGMTTSYSLEKWKESLAGLAPMFLSSNVYQPEFDGQLITTIFAYTEQVQTEFGSTTVFLPIEDRAEKLVKLAKNWSMLRHISMNQKKVAIILHNMPNRNDMIGAAYGLDTPASVYNMVEMLRENGLKTEFTFENGKDIIQRITNGLTNDSRYISPEEMLRKAELTAKKEEYTPWFEQYPEKVKQEIAKDWGTPPGEFMVVEEEILIPGIVNGNLFIGLQPPRAFEEKAEESYHSTDLVCPYQYLAFYHYLEHIYKANIIVHVGTHGTLEWLPGKEIGLSKKCYPDIAIGEMPHIYPYIIDDPGEGAQAKRRSSAGILEHLIPSMKESGVYGELAQIDELMAQYYKAMADNPEKMPLIAEQVWDVAVENNLHQDIQLTETEFNENVQEGMEKLHLWVSEIKMAEIKDGLHTFGMAPTKEDQRMKNMLRLLVRVRNGEIPSLREGISLCYQYDIDYILDHPQELNTEGKTNAMLLDEIDQKGHEIFDFLDQHEYSNHYIHKAIQTSIEPEYMVNANPLKECLEFVCNEIYLKLKDTTDELKYFQKAVEGKFIAPGPAGAPSRGNADILPTGRNFYMIDPSTIPSRASYKVGMILANQLIAKYKEENGMDLESIGIIVYSGETMKTSGDDIGEILYLYGVKPVYLGNTDRVIGLEVISLEELGRPRIDVTLRITGLFRDTFPNLIELIDQAATMVAALEEPNDKNFVRRNMLEDVKKFLGEGMSEDLAIQRSSIRVFGCPPGTYGAGVDTLVNTKKWENSDDLGQAYIGWSGHVYTSKLHGDKTPELFAHRLSSCDATVQNICSCEQDMLDDADYYNYHGGMIAAVKKEKGELPSSYSTGTGDVGHIVTKSIQEETAKIMRARINNPQWIEGLKKHGFRGAQEFSAMVDIVFGWDATSNTIEDWMYNSIYESYIHNEELRKWIEEENQWALHAMSERLLEADQRGMWNASEDKLELLREIYLQMEGNMEQGSL